MKKVLTLLFIAISYNSFSQGMLNVSAIPTGFCAGGGVTLEHFEAEAKVSFPVNSNVYPTVYSFTAGYKYQSETDYTFVLSAGVSQFRVKTLDNKGDLTPMIKKTYPIVNLEVGKTLFCGRLFLRGNYIVSDLCHRLYPEIGIKLFSSKQSKKD